MTDTNKEEAPATKSVRCAVDVVAGVLPGTPEPEFTRTFHITSDEWYAADQDNKLNLLSDLAGRANGYAQYLMLAPDRFNWVKTEWVWI
jgi:hypothetical protein